MNPAPEFSSPTPTASFDQMNYLQIVMRLESQMRNGASWFYWIAGLSLLNTIISFMNGNLSLLAGLGITQFVDGFAIALAEDLTGNGVFIVKIIGLGINICIAALFVAAGVLASKRMQWAFMIGMLLYGLDSLIFLVFQVWLDFGFHLFALWGIFQGLKALHSLRKLDSEVSPSALSPA